MGLALGYLDAGTGSMVVAALAGGVAGVGVLLRMYGNRFLGIFSAKHRDRAAEAAAEIRGADAITDE